MSSKFEFAKGLGFKPPEPPVALCSACGQKVLAVRGDLWLDAEPEVRYVLRGRDGRDVMEARTFQKHKCPREGRG